MVSYHIEGVRTPVVEVTDFDPTMVVGLQHLVGLEII